MLKKIGAKYTLVGHSDNRGEGDTDAMLKSKVNYALKNNLKVIFCIGENKTEKRNKKTINVLKKQLVNVLDKKLNRNNIIVECFATPTACRAYNVTISSHRKAGALLMPI